MIDAIKKYKINKAKFNVRYYSWEIAHGKMRYMEDDREGVDEEYDINLDTYQDVRYENELIRPRAKFKNWNNGHWQIEF